MKVNLNWVQDFVKLKPPVESVAERLTLAGLEVEKVTTVSEPEKTTFFEVEVTSNRPDWLSHYGVARELAAVENLSLKSPQIGEIKGRKSAPGWKVNLKDATGCPYYTGVLIEGITNYETPDFMKNRLEACGVRSINLIVDITNYVLLEVGQPLHAFDADLLRGKEIRVRKAKEKEILKTIDETEVKLGAKDLVIADGERPVALAGVMGGLNTEVTDKTRNVFLESAFFHPALVRRMARDYNFSSESSYRFERRVDPEGVDMGRERALWLIQKYAKPRFISTVIKSGQKPAPEKKSLLLSADAIENVLGVKIKPNQVSSILSRLGLHSTATSTKGWKVTIPSFRPDLTRPVDLIEEVARIYGFDQLPESLPAREPIEHEKNDLLLAEDSVRDYLVGVGLFETVTFSLVAKKGMSPEVLEQGVPIVNPQNKELSTMRPVLYTSLLDVVRRNVHLGTHEVFIFEIANTYHSKPGGKHPDEALTLSIALSGAWQKKTWLDPERAVSFYDLKGVIQGVFEKFGVGDVEFAVADEAAHLKEQVREQILIGGEVVGWLGQVSETLAGEFDIEAPVFAAEISLVQVAEKVKWLKTLKELSKFPSISRDISVTLSDDIKAGEVQGIIFDLGKGLVREVEVFDLFKGGRVPKGYKNLGFRVVYQSDEKTLISSEIQDLHDSIASHIAKKYQATFQ